LVAEKRLRDRDVRQAVHDAVAADHAQALDTMILHEFGLRHGMAREACAGASPRQPGMCRSGQRPARIRS